MIEALRKVIKRLHYPIEVMLVCVRWRTPRSSLIIAVAYASWLLRQNPRRAVCR